MYICLDADNEYYGIGDSVDAAFKDCAGGDCEVGSCSFYKLDSPLDVVITVTEILTEDTRRKKK